MAACCKCNRSGSCLRCACVKACKLCENCLPGKLGHCGNRTTSNVSSADMPASTADNFAATNVTVSTASTSEMRTTETTSVTETVSVVGTCPDLPEFPPASCSTFRWGDSLSGEDFSASLDATYAEVVHWRRNTFTVPFGRVGKKFVSELSNLYLSFGSASTLEAIALKAATVLPILLLQKPSKGSKAKDHVTILERRLDSWSAGDLDGLVKEGRAIQQRLPRSDTSNGSSNLARNFSNLMFAVKCKAALDLLSNSSSRGLLHLNNPVEASNPDSPSVKQILISKHPEGQPAVLSPWNQKILIQSSLTLSMTIYFTQQL